MAMSDKAKLEALIGPLEAALEEAQRQLTRDMSATRAASKYHPIFDALDEHAQPAKAKVVMPPTIFCRHCGTSIHNKEWFFRIHQQACKERAYAEGKQNSFDGWTGQRMPSGFKRKNEVRI